MKVVRTFIRFFKMDKAGNEKDAEYLVDNREIYNLVNPDGSALGFYFFDAEVDEENVILNEKNRFQAKVKVELVNVSGRYYFDGQVYAIEELGDVKDVIGEELYQMMMDSGISHFVRMMNGVWQEFKLGKDKVLPNTLFSNNILELKSGFTDPLDIISDLTESMEEKKNV